MKTSLIKLFAFLIVTIIPVFLVLYFKEKNNFKNSAAPKPIWALDSTIVDGKKEIIYHQVPYLLGQNADGKMISTDVMTGKVSVVEVFFTQCPSICPIMNKQMQRVFDAFRNNERFRIFSYSIDYERDSLSALKDYAKKHNANLDKWYFLRTEQDSLFNFGTKGLKIPISDEDSQDKFLHSERFVLIDWNKNIRGYYMGTDSLEVNKMMNHIVLLLSEKDRLDKKKKK
jgi:protein SCO1/2